MELTWTRCSRVEKFIITGSTNIIIIKEHQLLPVFPQFFVADWLGLLCSQTGPICVCVFFGFTCLTGEQCHLTDETTTTTYTKTTPKTNTVCWALRARQKRSKALLLFQYLICQCMQLQYPCWRFNLLFSWLEAAECETEPPIPYTHTHTHPCGPLFFFRTMCKKL